MFLKPHAKKVKIANLFIGTLKENSSGDQPPLNSLSKTQVPFLDKSKTLALAKEKGDKKKGRKFSVLDAETSKLSLLVNAESAAETFEGFAPLDAPKTINHAGMKALPSVIEEESSGSDKNTKKTKN